MRIRPGLGVLIAACVALSVGYGVRQSLGLFIAPLEGARGWSAGVFALAFALQNLVWGLAQPFVGAVADQLQRILRDDVRACDPVADELRLPGDQRGVGCRRGRRDHQTDRG